ACSTTPSSSVSSRRFPAPGSTKTARFRAPGRNEKPTWRGCARAGARSTCCGRGPSVRALADPSAPFAFCYAVLRVVPHVEREEFVNAGVALFCDTLDFLDARAALEEPRLLSLAADADVALARAHLEAIPRICAGGEGSGPIGALPL